MVDVIIPADLWEDDSQAVVTAWLSDEGAQVNSGDLIAEIMVAKAQYEITAPAAGTLRILKQIDDIVSKGDVIGTVG